MKFFLYLFKFGYINNVVKQIIIGAFFYNPIYYLYSYEIFFCFLF